MNGGCLPMLGRQRGRSRRQNVGVKKAPSPRIRTRSQRRLPRRAGVVAGFTLIEVLVALIVLVLGVLGAAAMTLNAIRDSKQSGLRSQASALAYEIGDLMRANRNPSQETVFTGAPPTGAISSCWTTGCIPSDMAKNDYFRWRQKLQGTTGVAAVLPNGDAVICRDATMLASYPACDNLATSPLVVKLKWDEKNNNARSTTGPTAVTTQYMVVTVQSY